MSSRPSTAHEPSPVALLAERLNALRLETGLSLRQLQRHTHSSDSSLSRYFAGRITPPWSVVEALCELTGQDPAGLRALWQAAARVRAAVRTEPASRTTSGPTPRQLPPNPRHFIGRVAETAVLSRAMRRRDGAVLVIAGVAGVGKTALALTWAHGTSQDFPDGQLYVNLRGFDPSGTPLAPQDALAGFLTALGISPRRVPAALADRSALYRSITADKQLLVVLDNAADTVQVRDLLPAGPGCLTLVTSRDRLAGLVAAEGAEPIRLDPLGAPDAVRLLAARLGANRVADDESAVAEVVAACAGLPLALSVVAARLALEPELATAVLGARLRDERNRLAELGVEDSLADVRAVFSWSFRRLGSAAAALFVRLGLHPGPTFSADAAAQLVATDPGPGAPLDASAALRELVGTHLVIPAANGRFQLHDLIRLYALELAATTLDPSQIRAVRTRMLDHYLVAALEADRLLTPARPPLPVSPAATRNPDDPSPFARPDEAAAWFDEERDVLLGVSAIAAAERFDTHAWQLPFAITIYLDRRGDWRTLTDQLEQAVAAAERFGDPRCLSRILGDAAQGQCRIGQYETALAHLQRAKEIFQATTDYHGLARVERVMGLIAEGKGDLTTRLAHSSNALRYARLGGGDLDIAQCLTSLSWAHFQVGDYEAAFEIAREGLAHQERVGYVTGQADVLNTMAQSCQHLGRHTEALDYFRRSEAGYAAVGARYHQCLELARIARLHEFLGDAAQGRLFRKAAWATVDSLDLADDDPIYAELSETQ